jgi:hypothetical protein
MIGVCLFLSCPNMIVVFFTMQSVRIRCTVGGGHVVSTTAPPSAVAPQAHLASAVLQTPPSGAAPQAPRVCAMPQAQHVSPAPQGLPQAQTPCRVTRSSSRATPEAAGVPANVSAAKATANAAPATTRSRSAQAGPSQAEDSPGFVFEGNVFTRKFVD